MFGCASVAVAAGYICFWLYHPVGTGPAGPPVPRGPFETVWSTRPVLLVGLGDSVTAGFGASEGHSYFARLAANPPDEFADMEGRCLAKVLPNLQTRNLARSGSTSLDHADLLLPQLETQPAETFGLVVLTTGGNDIIHNYGRSAPKEGAMYGATWEQSQPWIKNFQQRLDRLLDGITDRFPGGCQIFLANIYDPTDGIGDAERAGLPAWRDGLRIHAAYNAIIARVGAERPNVRVVDMHGAFLGHGIHCRQFWRSHYDRSDPTYWYFENLEDPNERGYDAIRRLMLIEMAKILPETVRAEHH
jgi:lysophospholipase L1-like esterase